MNRRQLITACGGVVATSGCAAIGLPGNDGTTENNPFERRSVSIVSTDELPDRIPASIAIEADPSTATPEHTVHFKTTLTNEADETKTFDVTESAVLRSLATQSTPGGYVLLLSNGGWTKDDRQPNCWENNDPKDPYRVAIAGFEAKLQPGESYTGDVMLWGAVNDARGFDDDVCWPTGEFGFDNAIRLGDPLFVWGFRFRVTEI